MARATKAAAAKPAPEPEQDEDEFPLAYLLEKEPSEVHTRFCEWIADQTGEDDIADPKTVQLVISQYQKFQKTPEHQEYLKDKRAASADAKADREKKAADRAAAAPADKPTRTRAASADAEPARPAGRARRGAVTPPPAKRASSRRRPAPAAASAEID
jgi:hypothetical protein